MARKTEKKTETKKPVEAEPHNSSSDEETDFGGIEQEKPQDPSGHSVNIHSSKPVKAAKQGTQRGVIYVGRLPKTFEEREMKKYFRQFGDVLRSRISRNKETGGSRHYGFVEFKDILDARVAAETMNNYLIMGHLLKVHVVENPKDNLFPAKLILNFREFDWRGRKFDKFHAKKTSEEWERLQEEFVNSQEEQRLVLRAAGITPVI